MPTYVAFLRAINLGSTRKFGKDAVLSCAERAGFTEAETYLNTGNLRVSTRLRSAARVEAVLEEAFEADRGFAVPTVALTTAELAGVVADADRFAAARGDGGQHHVCLLKEPATEEGLAALRAKAGPGEQAEAAGRAVHLLIGAEYHTAKLTNATVERYLGVATARNLTVIRETARRWC